MAAAAAKVMEVIEIDDFSPSPDTKSTPLRPVFCLKNRSQMSKIEEQEECFILEFDPDDDLDISGLCFFDDSGKPEVDLRVVAEKGQVACRDYPHPRSTCAEFPFEKTPHESHCEQCYCYVCDLVAPCEKWKGTSGHCHAFNNEAWNNEKKVKRQSVKTM